MYLLMKRLRRFIFYNIIFEHANTGASMPVMNYKTARSAVCCCLLLLSCIARGQNEQHMFWALNKCTLLLRQLTITATGAYSLRKLNCTYTGPAIQVRKSSSGATQNIGFNPFGDLDTVSLKSFIGSDNGSIAIWYDQSGNGRNAIQTLSINQPLIVSAGVLVTANVGRTPALLFSGNQWLDCGTSVQAMTNLGADGSVFSILTASAGTQCHFGAFTLTDRWSAHINWSDNNIYFDPGDCCGTTRVIYANSSSVGLWRQYSLIRYPNSSVIRLSGAVAATTTGILATTRCTSTANFLIGAANASLLSPMTGKMCEFIMFSSGVSGANLAAIESNQKLYWKTL